jgi:hypothetical protein
MMNSASSYASKKEIDQAYETAERFLSWVEAIHEGLSILVDPFSVYGFLSEFIVDHVSEVKELQSLKESLGFHFELIAPNRRFAHAAILLVSDDSKKPIQEEFDQLYEDVRDWSRILLYRLQNWKKPLDKEAMEDAINSLPGASFGVEFVGDPFLDDPDNWPVLFPDGKLCEGETDPRLLDLLREMEEILFVSHCDYRNIDGERVYQPIYLRKKCRLEHSQLLRDLALLPMNTTFPNGSGRETRFLEADSKEQSKPKRGRRSKADLKSRSNREMLIAILHHHHEYESRNGLKLEPIPTEEACKRLGKSESTLSKTWKEIQPPLTYAKYVQLCGRYKSLETFLKSIDSKGGYLERSNRGESIDNSED